ncbi:uncharacterized protein [Rutidosis leptorrhynchoides]|uniref:uncharacterized protein n=1 Tax=Rutidosis leptorrhynchoides TaxID=125765 RepID=UPI003A9A3B6E
MILEHSAIPLIPSRSCHLDFLTSPMRGSPRTIDEPKRKEKRQKGTGGSSGILAPIQLSDPHMEKVDEAYKLVAAKLKKEKNWKFEDDMKLDFEKDDNLYLAGVCALI